MMASPSVHLGNHDMETVGFNQNTLYQLLLGCLAGTATGDSLGLPAEALSAGTVRRRWKGKWNQGFFFKYGMVTDDTEQTVMVARALMRHPSDPALFQKQVARALRWWLLGLPPAIGLATLKAIIRLWLGFSPERSGTYSAGNGPAMRIALVGVCFFNNPDKLRQYVHAATCVTHRDPKAETGARAVALVAAHITRFGLGLESALLPGLYTLSSIDSRDETWGNLVDRIQSALDKGESVSEFASSLGLSKGVTGYIYHTVPVVLYALYLHNGDFKTGLESVLNLGGDTDTTGAIYGALAGITGTIPETWTAHLKDYPFNMTYFKNHA